jgi:hypothetical protein
MTDPFQKRIIHTAALLTSILAALAGIGLLLAYFRIEIPRHPSQLVLGAIAVAGATTSLILFTRKKRFKGLIILFSLIFVIELWTFTIGMAIAENKRTLRPFSQKAAARLQYISDDKIAFYQVGDSALVFYLKRNPLMHFNNIEEVKGFMYKNPDGFIIANLSTLPTFQHEKDLEKIVPVIIEKPVLNKKDDPLALFALSEK